MDAGRFDALTRSLSAVGTRRALAAAGLAAFGAPPIAAKKRKRRKRRVRFNAFGCANVGGFCKNAGHCCSGICTGKKGKKRCRAHDTGGCALGDNFCAGGADAPCGPSGACVCNITTGNAPHCGAAAFCPAAECRKDADCGEPGAACIPPANCQGCGSPATRNFCQRPCVG